MIEKLNLQKNSSKVSRRKLLGTTATIGVSGLAGCADNQPRLDLTIPNRYEYFKRVDYNPEQRILGDYTTIQVKLHQNAVQEREIDAVLLFFDGIQVDDKQLATGEQSVEFSPLELTVENIRKTNTISVAVVTGGQHDGVNWVDGEILEQVELNKQKQSAQTTEKTDQ